MRMRASKKSPDESRERSASREFRAVLGGWFTIPAAAAVAALTGYSEEMNGINEHINRTLELAITPTAVVVALAAATMALLIQTRADTALENLDRSRLLLSSWMQFISAVGAMGFILLRVRFVESDTAPLLGALASFFLVMVFATLLSYIVLCFKFTSDALRKNGSDLDAPAGAGPENASGRPEVETSAE